MTRSWFGPSIRRGGGALLSALAATTGRLGIRTAAAVRSLAQISSA